MKKLALAAGVTLAFSMSTVLAAAPALKTTESVTINAPASEVWTRVKDFDGLHKWHPAVAKDEIVAGENNKPGAVRLLTLKDGGTIKEELQKMNNAGKSYQYKIIEGVLPVSSYSSTVSVKEAGKGKSKVTWSGNFKRKDIRTHFINIGEAGSWSKPDEQSR